jgi:hypothetical protein
VAPLEDLTALAELIASRPPLGVAVIAKPQRQGASLGEAATLSLGGDAQDFFHGVLAKSVVKPVRGDAWRLRPRDPVYKPEVDEVEYVGLDNAPAVKLAIERYGNLGPFDEFTGDDAFVKQLRYYVAVLGAPGDAQAFFFRSFTDSSELRRKRGAALMRRGGQFSVVEERIFLFDEAVDCIVFRDWLFVLRKGDYRRIFDDFEVVRQQAHAAAGALHAQVPISNFEAFRDACARQITMADKLLAIRSRDYFPSLTVDILESVIDEFGLEVELVEHNGQKQLVFQTDAAHRWLILKLLDDDYLRSSMTEHRYEANSKQQSA